MRKELGRIEEEGIFNVFGLLRNFLENMDSLLTALDFLDESPICKSDLEDMEAAVKSGMAKNLAWLAQRVQLAWVRLSTSDLPDTTTQGSVPTLLVLFEHLNQH